MRSARSTRLNVWPPLPPSIYAGRRRGHLRSRWRIAAAVSTPWVAMRCFRACGRPASTGDEILVPAYHHGSEVEALVRAGLTCRFYAGTAGLAPDAVELDALVGRRTRALLLIHYLGLPQDAARWREWCGERALVLVEDAAQAWLARTADGPVGSFGDVAVYCLYKTYGLPDGAALVAPNVAGNSPPRRPLGLGLLARRHVAWVRSRVPLERKGSTRVAPAAGATPDEDFALGDPALGPAGTTVAASGSSAAMTRPPNVERTTNGCKTASTSSSLLLSGSFRAVRRLSCSRWPRSPSPRCSAPRSRGDPCVRLLVGSSSVPAGEGVPRGAGAPTRGHRAPRPPRAPSG